MPAVLASTSAVIRLTIFLCEADAQDNVGEDFRAALMLLKHEFSPLFPNRPQLLVDDFISARRVLAMETTRGAAELYRGGGLAGSWGSLSLENGSFVRGTHSAKLSPGNSPPSVPRIVVQWGR